MWATEYIKIDKDCPFKQPRFPIRLRDSAKSYLDGTCVGYKHYLTPKHIPIACLTEEYAIGYIEGDIALSEVGYVLAAASEMNVKPALLTVIRHTGDTQEINVIKNLNLGIEIFMIETRFIKPHIYKLKTRQDN